MSQKIVGSRHDMNIDLNLQCNSCMCLLAVKVSDTYVILTLPFIHVI